MLDNSASVKNTSFAIFIFSQSDIKYHHELQEALQEANVKTMFMQKYIKIHYSKYLQDLW